jgi:DUF1680 family protein
MEAVLYNTILGARPIQPNGVSFYYSDYNRGARKVDYDQKWPCCSGTFPQLTADYGISSYFRSGRGVYVNLYVPSKVSWQQGDARVELTQKTEYPRVGETALHIKLDRPQKFVVALRIPAWAGTHSAVRVNGRPGDTAIHPGNWAEVDRTWKDGDRIELSLDMPLRLVPIDARHQDTVALVRGPVALFAIEPIPAKLSKQQLLAAKQVGNSDVFELTSPSGKVRMVPFPSITNQLYRLYHAT